MFKVTEKNEEKMVALSEERGNGGMEKRRFFQLKHFLLTGSVLEKVG